MVTLRPRVTVVIPNWNGLVHMRTCLDALRRQDYPNFEVHVVDNGSTDGSVDSIRREYPEVVLLPQASNLGFAAGVNVSLQRLDTPYYALLNNDTEVEPTWLSALVRALEEKREFGAATSRSMQFDRRDLIDNCGVAVTTIATAFYIGRGERVPGRHDASVEVFCPCAAAALYRTELLRDVGLFDEAFFAGYEDVDLGFRARRLGWRTIYVPDAVVYHKIHATLETVAHRSAYLAQRNVEWVWLKNMPGALMLRYAHVRLLYEMAGLVYFTRAGALGPYLRAKRDVLADLGRILRLRKEEQQRSRLSTEELRLLLDRRAVRSRVSKFFQRRARSVSR